MTWSNRGASSGAQIQISLPSLATYSGSSPNSSQAAVTALLETLIALLVARAGEEAQARIEAFHAERLAAGNYEEEPRLGAIG